MAGIEQAKGKIQRGAEHFKESGAPCKEGGEKLEGAVDALLLAHTGMLGVIENLKRAGVFFGEAVVPFQEAAAKAKSGVEMFKEVATASAQQPSVYQNIKSCEGVADTLNVQAENSQQAKHTGLPIVTRQLQGMYDELQGNIEYWQERKRLSGEYYSEQVIPFVSGFTEDWQSKL